jgi:uncharacterized phage protein gp47/JayE
MPWTTPTLRVVRQTVRGEITTALGRASFVGNSVLRVMADAMAALAHLTLRYLDWLALQLLPDTAEHEWLDRHGDIWLVNADGTIGRKVATPAKGTITITGTPGVVVPAGTQLISDNNINYETIEDVTTGASPVNVGIVAIDYGALGNMDEGAQLSFVATPAGVDGTATVVELTGGTDDETDNQLRQRILQRIRNPAMGGSQADYVTWALAVPGVTRAWAAPEQGTGTITVRFLMDDLRAADDGWPTPADVEIVATYIDKMRPVTVKDCYVLAPIKEFIDVTIANLMPDTEAARAEIEKSIEDMLFAKAAPGQTIYAAWISYAILNAPSVQSFELVTTVDYVMPSLGHMAVLETILYE